MVDTPQMPKGGMGPGGEGNQDHLGEGGSHYVTPKPGEKKVKIRQIIAFMIRKEMFGPDDNDFLAKVVGDTEIRGSALEELLRGTTAGKKVLQYLELEKDLGPDITGTLPRL